MKGEGTKFKRSAGRPRGGGQPREPRYTRLKAWPILRRAGVLAELSNEEAFALGNAELWRRFVERGGVPVGQEEPLATIQLYRRVRRILEAGAEPYPEAIIRLALVVLGSGVRPTYGNLQPLLGRPSADDLEKAVVLAGFLPRKRIRPPSFASPSDLIRLFAPQDRLAVQKIFRHAENSRRQEDLPPKSHFGRVTQLGPALAFLGAVVVTRYTETGYKPRTGMASLSYLELVDDLLELSGRSDPGAMLCELYEGQRSNSDKRAQIAVGRALVRYSLDLSSARAWIEDVLGGSPAARSLLPTCDLRAKAFAAAFKRRSRSKATSKSKRRGDLKKQTVAPREMIVRLENRIHQVEAIHEEAKSQLELARNYPSLLPLRFAVSVRSVAADGTWDGVSTQLVHLRLDAPQNCVSAAAALWAGNPLRFGWMATEFEQSRVRREWAAKLPEPAKWALDDLLLIYEGHSGPGSCEPFFVDLYSWGLLEPSRTHSPTIMRKRTELLRAAGLKVPKRIPTEVMVHSFELGKIAAVVRGPDPELGQLAIPIRGLLHGLYYARFAYHLIKSHGPRTGEIIQVQQGEPFMEERQAYGDEDLVRVVPKGWEDLSTKTLNAATVEALKTMRTFTCERWFGMKPGDESFPLPTRAFPAIQARPQIGEGKFVFQSRLAAFDGGHLNFVLRAAFYGIAALDVHLERFGKITRMARDGVAKATQQFIADHGPGSDSTEHYNLGSAEEAADAAGEAAAEFEQELGLT